MTSFLKKHILREVAAGVCRGIKPAWGWELIGYTAPGTASGTTSSTTNFTYEQKGTYNENTIQTDPSDAEVWRATAKVVLNDCGTEDYWYVTATVTSAKVSFDAKLSDETNCLTLTPTFTNIGK